MDRVGSYEAKTRLAALLKRVEAGETIEITRNGRPVAKLVPADPRRQEATRRALDRLRNLRRHTRLGPATRLRDLIEDGRRH
ncbi:MAG: type II toxin-antitoxin system prevent-host-death family antitoxin [Alphaproteobacteria bacterium]|nr:MAG: type II toxin-antitoxin system prevent-host-death family antitoxin [Alphaproteobacteria bacterium]